jgi:hypothetical protein
MDMNTRRCGLGLIVGLAAMVVIEQGCAQARAFEEKVDLPSAAAAGTGSAGQSGQPITKMRVSMGIGVQVETPLWNSECSREYRKCIAQLPVVVENRSGANAISVEGIEFAAGREPYLRVRRASMVPVSVAGGGRIRHMLPGIHDSEEELFVRAVVRLADGTIVRAASDPFYLPNLSRVAEMDACERRGGRWDRCYNMACYSRCAERASDAGKPCRDGLECEGLCLFDGYERNAADGRRSVRRAVGHCSPDRSPSGCVTFIPKGASSEGPSGPGWEEVCSD